MRTATIGVDAPPGCGSYCEPSVPQDKLTDRHADPEKIDPEVEPSTAHPMPLDASRNRKTDKGERNKEKSNPNPDQKPGNWRRNKDGRCQYKPHNGDWQDPIRNLPPGVKEPTGSSNNYRASANKGAAQESKPSDADHDGKVTDEEEAAWSRNMQ